jgi:hypothetical protein
MKDYIMYKKRKIYFILFLVIFANINLAFAQNHSQWIVYQGNKGPGEGKHIVFISGDEEYRSEEGLPMLAKILAERHGFKCTVLFAIDSATNNINPDNQTNIPGLAKLNTADLMVLLIRFRELPDQQMKYFDEYTHSGKPVIALRTSTHGFNYSRNINSPYAKYTYNSKIPGWEGGYGKRVLGETWINHHGVHGIEGTRALINGLMKDHPILKGVKDIWGPSDVYGINSLTENSQVLLFGQSTLGMTASAELSFNKSIMPIAWIKDYNLGNGKKAKIFTSTMGASVDLLSEDLRRLIVNAAYWATGLENKIPEKNNVEFIGEYKPSMFGFGKYEKGVNPNSLIYEK